MWSEEFLSPSHLLDSNKKWKNDFILKNKLLFEYNKEFISNWLKKWNYLNEFTKTEKKLEWQCGAIINLFETL
ncbi:hypothetical protein [Mycoplasmopsis felis]|uniref:hypothetical protein n=1 Tax=Mycoplasmopsis felis TaxID=33923 RepID=UPI002AFF892F|nr:hypothetical protein [Mycoplasmopsis felis]WQQ03000.1 hypothetical protein RRG38_02480 [Mycoplasmopsis felis]